MSDSDDTDILLLIPPNFFLTTLAADAKLQQKDSKNYIHDSVDVIKKSRDSTAMNNKAEQYISQAGEGLNTISHSYQFLPPSKQSELNSINVCLTSIEQELIPSSDISSITNFTMQSQLAETYKNQQTSLAHSTPKDKFPLEFSKVNEITEITEDDGVLHEIDNFLQDPNYISFCNLNGRKSEHFDAMSTENENNQALSLPNCAVTPNINKYDKTLSEKNVNQVQNQQQDTLISLDEIWGKNGRKSTLTLKEEQYRRLHLEKIVRKLQDHLLEYKQRLSVAIEVDRSKDSALSNVQTENKSLSQENRRLRDSVFKLEAELNGFNQKQDTLQKELSQALGLVAKYQDKNEKLENEINSASKISNQCNKQIEELETRISSYKKSEDLSDAEINKLKDKLAKAEYNEDKAIKRRDQIEKDFETVKHQKNLLQEFHQKQKNRADLLENQKKSLQQAVSNLTEKELTLERKLETQKQALKSHYQQQLENVVSQKLLEFQEQLDKVEETLKAEARDRERLIADRAIKQLELINEKNELELKLIQEKHNEEIELYRIQLANASRKIDDLEERLNAYKSKRADIAEKLHNIMETQWQKALEILTSPNQLRSNSSNQEERTDRILVEEQKDFLGESQSRVENEMFETPTKNRSKKTKAAKQDNSFAAATNYTEPHVDKLRAYIELLLRKSPTDFDKLDEILAQSKPKCGSGKVDKSAKRSSSSKPPWKS